MVNYLVEIQYKMTELYIINPKYYIYCIDYYSLSNTYRMSK